MTAQPVSASAHWYRDGPSGYDLRAMKSAAGILDLVEYERPAGSMSRSGLPDLVLCQDMSGGSHVTGNLGGGRFDVMSRKGGLYLCAPNFALSSTVDVGHALRVVAFPIAQWHSMLDEAVDGQFSFNLARVYDGTFDSPTIRAGLRKLWALCDDEGAPSRMLMRAAGCEILAELCRLGGAPFTPAKGGLAPGRSVAAWT